jgi:hypothetical protein
MGTREP